MTPGSNTFTPLSGDPDFMQAVMRLLQGDPEGTVEILQQNQAGDAWVARREILAAVAHLQDFDLVPAERSARDAVSASPESWVAWALLVACLQLQGKCAEAIETCRDSLELYPLPGFGRFMLGILSEQDGQIPEAIDAYTQAVQENPTMEKAYYRLSVAHMRDGNSAASAEAMKNGLRTNPSIPRRVALADIHLQESNYEAALEELEYVRELAPQPMTLYRLATVYHAIGRTDESIALREEVAKVTPRKWQNYLELAQIYVEHNRFEEAIDAYQKTLKIVPIYIAPLLGLIDAYLAVENTDDARATLKTAYKVFPHHPRVVELVDTLGRPQEDEDENASGNSE